MKTDPYIEPLTTKLTRIGNWWHCQVFANGKLYDELRCDTKADIGWCFREIMRWYDKMGGCSKWASSARKRHGEKENYKTYGVIQSI
jgi:hypothetical protein